MIDSNAGSGYPVVDTDQAQGARLATEHLLDLGHRQGVAHRRAPSRPSRPCTGRSPGAARSRRPASRPPQCSTATGPTESGYRLGLELGARPGVTAIFAANDQMALGAMRALHELGRDIPEDVSVVGFDDMDEARAFWPPLTTVRQDFRAVGRLSIEKLLQQIAGNTPASVVTTVPTRLMVRKSTTAPARPGSTA